MRKGKCTKIKDEKKMAPERGYRREGKCKDKEMIDDERKRKDQRKLKNTACT